jgi:hypothetical protein
VTVALPAYRERVLARSLTIARLDHGPRGAFLRFDSHLCADAPTRRSSIRANSNGAANTYCAVAT